MRQLTFLSEVVDTQKDLTHDTFSHAGVCPQTARIALETRYRHLLQETDEFNRQLVSFQANKTEVLHSWIKYREGFSANLVEILIEKFELCPGETVFDPFAGSGTTLLVAQMLGIDAVGIDLLPHSHLAWKAKSRVFEYDLDELRTIRKLVIDAPPPVCNTAFPHLAITETAFPLQAERELAGYTRWLLEELALSENARTLCRLILTSILEDISFTRKDGQYLRWDRRADKVQQRNMTRVAKGKPPVEGIDKGELPNVKTALLAAMNKVIADITELQADPPPPSQQTLIEGNTLHILPKMEADQFSAVITSPPYANRYDYTRTYALELAYLGVGEEIFKLRQRLLSCTVENRSKTGELERVSIARSANQNGMPKL